VIYSPLSRAVHHVSRPRHKEELKSALKYVRGHIETGDKLYLYYFAEPGFRYYDEFYGVDYDDFVLTGPGPAHKYTRQIDYFRREKSGGKIKDCHAEACDFILGISYGFDGCRNEIGRLTGNRRVWFIFSHIRDNSVFIDYLDQNGKRLDYYRKPGAFVYLYNMELQR